MKFDSVLFRSRGKRAIQISLSANFRAGKIKHGGGGHYRRQRPGPYHGPYPGPGGYYNYGGYGGGYGYGNIGLNNNGFYCKR